MSVMQCGRKGCENIMCNHFSNYYGYICYECLTELRSKVPHVSVDMFMDSQKKAPDLTESVMLRAALDFIDKEFMSI